MSHLTLAGLSEDKQRLLLVSDSGEEYTLDIDARLRSALRGEHARLGQLEIQMESTLRPRDIQARIRAGESAESVAAAAHTTVERIRPFVDPVLAERAHMAERAQRGSVRRKSGDTGARTLGDAVRAQLRPADTIDWDAWRREDGRWTLVASYTAAKRSGTGHFCFDVPGNYVTAEDDDARWLVGEQVAKPAPPARDDLEAVRRRRLTVEADEQLPLGGDGVGDEAGEHLGEDAIALVKGTEPTPSADDETPTVDLQETREAVRRAAAPAEVEPPAAEQEPIPEPPATAEPPPAPPAPKKPSRRKGRASVPSWDEIMFGGKSE